MSFSIFGVSFPIMLAFMGITLHNGEPCHSPSCVRLRMSCNVFLYVCLMDALFTLLFIIFSHSFSITHEDAIVMKYNPCAAR